MFFFLNIYLNIGVREDTFEILHCCSFLKQPQHWASHVDNRTQARVIFYLPRLLAGSWIRSGTATVGGGFTHCNFFSRFIFDGRRFQECDLGVWETEPPAATSLDSMLGAQVPATATTQ